jgi:polysaccharide biosynthesis/export protein
VKLINVLLFVVVVCLFCSCATTKPQAYFQNIIKDTVLQQAETMANELKVKKGDQLLISISSLDPQSTTLFNQAGTFGTTGGGTSGGFTVDLEGNIELLKVGKLHVEGMTKAEVKSKIEKLLLPYLKEPLVAVKFANHKATVIGEVTHPAVLNISEKRVDIFDALVESGDVTSMANKEKVMVIRTTDSSKTYKMLDLTNSSVVTSPYYYLQPNDIVFVERRKLKKETSALNIQNYISLGVSLLSLIFLIAARVK